MGNHSIYLIRNTIDGKCYVGRSVDPKRRKLNHFADLRSKTHHNQYLQNAFNVHGESAFVFEVIETGISDEEVNAREIFWVSEYERQGNSYNLTGGGDEPVYSTCVRCTWNGVEYRSIAEAARACGVNLATMQERLANGATCDEDLRPRFRAVVYNGIEYASIKAAAIANGLTYSAMKARIQRDHTGDETMGYSNPYEWNGITYKTVSAAARALGVSIGAVEFRKRSGYTCDADLVGRSRLVTWNGVEYPSVRAAADANGVNYATMRSRIQAGMTGDGDIQQSQFKPKSIQVDNLVFASLNDAARHFNVTVSGVSYWLKTGRAREIR